VTCALCVPLLCASLYVTDGDTIYCDREKIRLMDFDALETRQAKCESELDAGYEAKARLLVLLRSGAATIERHGLDKYRRTLGRLYVDGIAVADVMIRELLARPYDGGKRSSWCESMD
jgi:endonuclease YncB( thermonuclease family)